MRTFTWIYTFGLALIVVNSARRSVSGESTDLGRLRADFHQTNPTTLCAPVSTTKITAVTMPVWSAHPVFAIHTNIVSAVTASTATSVPIATMSDFAPMFLRIFDLVARRARMSRTNCFMFVGSNSLAFATVNAETVK